MLRTVPVHNLRPNETTWTPPAVATLDTETRWATAGDTESHSLRCWAASLEVRRDSRKNVTWDDAESGLIAADAAWTLSAWNTKHPTLWVYCHNLAFDLTVSEVTAHLAELGYEVTGFAIDSPSPFVKMSRGRHHITFADSFSWLPAKLETVASALRMVKPDLPGNDDTDEFWLARCQADAAILLAAMTQIMGWWDANDLGHWSITGSSSGWNVMRHKIDARRFTINPSSEGIAFDRMAIYGGRRGLWQAGKLPAGRYADLDFSAAYPAIAETQLLPQERMAHFTSLPLDHQWLASDRHGVIARVRLRTDTARWPVRTGQRVWYPCGEFWTVLAGPEISEAKRLGCLLEIGEGYVHRLGYALAPWATWCLATSRGEQPGTPEVVRLWAKHCGRAVIGKWAQRKFSTIELGPSPRRGWFSEDGWNHTAGVRAVIIDFDGRRWQASADGDGDNCYPAVLAWVEAETRLRLGRLIESMPWGAPVACDTDGVLVNMNALADWELPGGEIAPLSARVKGEYTTVEVIGPQHLILDGHRRFAGIPGTAKPGKDGELTAQLWPKMAWQMANGRQGVYERPTQTYRVAATYAPGWILAGGAVIPIEMRITADGGNEIVPWPESNAAYIGYVLGRDQNRDLVRYSGGKDTPRA